MDSITNLLSQLKIDNVDLGITTASVEHRIERYGSNNREALARTPFWRLLKEALDDFMLKLLIVCAVFSIVVDMSFAAPEDRSHAWAEGAAILLAVSVVSLVNACSNYSKEG